MGRRTGMRSRQTTQDTLVSSPTVPTGPKQRSRFWRAGKRTSFDDGGVQRVPPSVDVSFQVEPNENLDRATRDIPRRSSTERTLVDSTDGKTSVKSDPTPSDGDDVIMVTSPISSTAPSAFFSPVSPYSGRPSPPSTVSGSSSPNVSKTQKWHTQLIGKTEKSYVEKSESARTTALFMARATLGVAEASNVPYLKGIASIALLILEYADGVAVNKEECSRIVDSVILLSKTLSSKTSGLNGRSSRVLEDQMDQLKTSLEAVLQDVKQLSDCGRRYLRRFTQMERDKEIIKRCNDRLDQALRIFTLQSSIEVQMQVADLSHTINAFHGQTDGNIHNEESQRETGFICMKSPDIPIEKKVFRKTVSAIALPPSPGIFLGRDEVLKQTVRAILDIDSARIAILGPGGVGKSSLALKVLYDIDVVERYGQKRFFIRCDSATSTEGLMSSVAFHLGLSEEQTRIQPGEIRSWLSETTSVSGPVILVLDNFETPWEPESSRNGVEEFLAGLASLPNVALLITLRGTERPSGVQWDRPLLRPLQTLDHQACRDMFLKISDAQYQQTYVKEVPDDLDELLALCGYLPLAVRLMAELAVPDIDTVPDLVKQWKTTSCGVSMLNNGTSPNHSLEVSIQLSLNSPRIKRIPDASALLGLVAELPDGIVQEDLGIAVPQLQDWNGCRLALIKTSLAYNDGDPKRLKMLAPIREYIRRSGEYKAKLNLIQPLEAYFFNFVKDAGGGQRNEEDIKRTLPELGNIESLIERAFSEKFEPYSAVVAANNLAQFFLQASLDVPRMAQIQRALTLARQMQMRKLEADCLYTITLANHRFFKVRKNPESCRDDYLAVLVIYEEVGDKTGQAHCFHQLGAVSHTFRRFEQAIEYTGKALRMYVEAGCLSGQSSSLLNLARFTLLLGDAENATKRAHASLNILRTKFFDPLSEALCLQFLGELQRSHLCNYADSSELLEESLRIYKALLLEDSSNCMHTRVSQGELALVYSKYVEAKDAFEKAVMVYRKTQRRDRLAYALVNLGLAKLGMGEAREASEQIHEGLSLWEKISNSWGIGISYCALGAVAMHDEDFLSAQARYETALNAFRKDSTVWKVDEAECHLQIGMTLVRLRQEDVGRARIEEALQLYESVDHRRGKANCRRRLAELDLKLEDDAAKREALTRMQIVVDEFRDMGLHGEANQSEVTMSEAYGLLGEKQPRKSLQLQIKV